MINFETELFQLLSITAPSGMEGPVARFITSRLKGCMDKVDDDAYGNVLAERTYGEGNGPTILLSSHMDTVWVEENREIIRDGYVWYSSDGPLGADDRAGIAIILTVLRNLEYSKFRGTVKVAFTKEEEVGLRGSQAIDQSWLEGIELGIVVDRRGSRDIVVRNHYLEFCPEEIGTYFERIGQECGMSDWQSVRGGSSDAAIYAERGIPSVNLSAGYYNEHTEDEYVNIDECRDTIELIYHSLSGLNQELLLKDSQAITQL